MEKLETKIEEIIEGMDCEKDLRCCKESFASVRKAKNIGINSFPERLDKKPAKVSILLALWIWTFLPISTSSLYR